MYAPAAGYWRSSLSLCYLTCDYSTNIILAWVWSNLHICLMISSHFWWPAAILAMSSQWVLATFSDIVQSRTFLLASETYGKKSKNSLAHMIVTAWSSGVRDLSSNVQSSWWCPPCSRGLPFPQSVPSHSWTWCLCAYVLSNVLPVLLHPMQLHQYCFEQWVLCLGQSLALLELVSTSSQNYNPRLGPWNRPLSNSTILISATL